MKVTLVDLGPDTFVPHLSAKAAVLTKRRQGRVILLAHSHAQVDLAALHLVDLRVQVTYQEGEKIL